MFFLIFLFAPCVLSLNCTNPFAFQGSSCIFNTQNNDGSCSSFNFVNCSWSECSKWVFTGKSSSCAQYVAKWDSSWKNCIQVCCEDKVENPPSWDSVQHCQDIIHQNNDNQKKVLIIVLCSVGGFFVMVVCTICCCYHRRQPEDSDPRQISGQAFVVYPSRQDYNAKKYIAQEVTTGFVGGQWVEHSEQLEKYKECCSVCLEEGVSLQLQCGHSYHRICIVECVSRKAECVLCRAANINNVKVYCQRCLKSYCNTTLFEHLKQLSGGQVKCVKCIGQGLEIEK